MMAFGKRSDKDDNDHTSGGQAEPEDDTEAQAADDRDDEVLEELEGPFDIDDFDDPAVAELARLDLGSVLIPMPETGQLQVELTETGVPSAGGPGPPFRTEWRPRRPFAPERAAPDPT